MRVLAAVISTIAVVPACDALVATDYAGEPLVRLQGAAVDTRSGDGVAAGGAMAALVWQGTEGAIAFTRLPLRVDFPVLWLDVLAPPPPPALFAVGAGEPAIAEAYFHLVRPDTRAVPHAGDVLATDYTHALVYVSADLAPASTTAAYLGAPLSAGFHLVVRSTVDALTAPQQQLVERCVAQAPPGAAARARAGCAAQRLYRLDPTTRDLATVLTFLFESPTT
ncbi:MAG: hypothetical protein K8W52_29060 [Deltaproteobacteria bacterium]|nr:hypothetical protein [Deltaproteobacteria bacterium]